MTDIRLARQVDTLINRKWHPDKGVPVMLTFGEKCIGAPNERCYHGCIFLNYTQIPTQVFKLVKEIVPLVPGTVGNH